MRGRAHADANGDTPELILLDAGTPDASGFDVATKLPGEFIGPIVMMLTSNDCVADMRRCREMGVSYMIKPVKQRELLALLRRLLIGCSEPPLAFGG